MAALPLGMRGAAASPLNPEQTIITSPDALQRITEPPYPAASVETLKPPRPAADLERRIVRLNRGGFQ